MPAYSAQRSHSHSKIMEIFRTLGSESLSVTAVLDFSDKANTSIHGLGEDDTARIDHTLLFILITKLIKFTMSTPYSAGINSSRQNLTSVDVTL